MMMQPRDCVVVRIRISGDEAIWPAPDKELVWAERGGQVCSHLGSTPATLSPCPALSQVTSLDRIRLAEKNVQKLAVFQRLAPNMANSEQPRLLCGYFSQVGR